MALLLQPLDEALRSRGIRLHYTSWLRLVRCKGLPAKKIGGRYFIDLAELDAWISAQGVSGVERAGTAPPIPHTMGVAAAELVLQKRRGGSRERACTPPAVDKTSGGA